MIHLRRPSRSELLARGVELERKISKLEHEHRRLTALLADHHIDPGDMPDERRMSERLAGELEKWLS